MGGAYGHVHHAVLPQLFEGRGHQGLLHLQLGLVQNVPQPEESLPLVQTQLVVLVAMET